MSKDMHLNFKILAKEISQAIKLVSCSMPKIHKTKQMKMELQTDL